MLLPHPSTTTPAPAINNNNHDDGGDDTTKKIVEQAASRLAFVRLIIKWQRLLAALDTYCEALEQYLRFARIIGYSSEEGRVANEKKRQQTHAAWRATHTHPDLLPLLKHMPERAVGPEDLLKEAQCFQSLYWSLFRDVFNTFLCGPVEMSTVLFPADDTWVKFHAALQYARQKGMITIPPGFGSFQPK
jgi:hypothetical protein